MAPLSRRETLRVAGAGAATSGLAGCLRRFRQGTVSIGIRNGHDRHHTLAVVFEDGDTTAYRNRYELSSGEDARTDDALEGGQYTVRALLETGTAETLEFGMRGCTDNTLSVYINQDGGLRLRVSGWCD